MIFVILYALYSCSANVERWTNRMKRLKRALFQALAYDEHWSSLEDEAGEVWLELGLHESCGPLAPITEPITPDGKHLYRSNYLGGTVLRRRHQF